MLESLEAETAARGDDVSRAQAVWWLSFLEWSVGRWQRAFDHAAVAYELAEQTQYAHARLWVGRAKALIEADLGLVDAARASAEEAIASSQATSSGLFGIVSLGVLGRIELALGNVEDGRQLPARPARTAARARDERPHPHDLGGRNRDARCSRRARAGGRLPRAVRADLEPVGEPLGRRCCCALPRLARQGRKVTPWRPSEPSSSALAELEEHPYPLERARTLLCLGVVRRQAQQKRSAREALEGALAIFEELGARIWAEKARAELGRIGGRAPASDELTETERRVAELAAQGPDEQGDRCRALHGREHGRGAPLARLPQARDPLPRGTCRKTRDNRHARRGVSR